VGLALGDQGVDRGVTFTGPHCQAPVPEVLGDGSPGGIDGPAGSGAIGLRAARFEIAGFGGGFWQVGAA
jgi:hypothetical protein